MSFAFNIAGCCNIGDWERKQEKALAALLCPVAGGTHDPPSISDPLQNCRDGRSIVNQRISVKVQKATVRFFDE
jgi:hypothetical protein